MEKQTILTALLCAASYTLGFAWKFKKREDLIKAQDERVAHYKAVMFLALDRLKKGVQNESGEYTGGNMAILKANDNVIDLLTEVLHAVEKSRSSLYPCHPRPTYTVAGVWR
jgi:hypothetical protein